VYRDGAICFIAVNKISHQRFDVSVEDEPDDLRIAVDYRGAGIAAVMSLVETKSTGPYFPIIRPHVNFAGRFNRLSAILPGSSFLFREMPSVTPRA
jgi:hypothetical protein